jgi:hypothetical protein
MANFRIGNWRQYTSGSLRGWFSLTLPSGLTIHNCQLFEKNGARWVGLPSTKFTSKDGAVTFKPIVEILDKTAAAEFRNLALEALDAMLRGEK